MYTSSHFTPVSLSGRNLSPDDFDTVRYRKIAERKQDLPSGKQTYWGIPFDCGQSMVCVEKGARSLSFDPVEARYLIFLHVADIPPYEPGEDGIIMNFRGNTKAMSPVCDYVIRYADGTSVTVPIRTRMELNGAAFLAMPLNRGHAFPDTTGEMVLTGKSKQHWGGGHTRVSWPNGAPSLYAFENPKPQIAVTGLEILVKEGALFLFGLTAGHVKEHPLRYGRRQKAALTLKGDPSDPLALCDIDMGHIISVKPRLAYGGEAWEDSSIYQYSPQIEGQYIVEFNAHEDAILYLGEDRTPLPLKELRSAPEIHINPAERPVTLKVLDPSGKPVPVRVHAHGMAGEYLVPRNRHRLPNPHWFEDFSVDYVKDTHLCTYIDGTAEYFLPLGEVYFEIAKGFEIKPVRRRFTVGSDTDEIIITLDRVIDWRSKGWVTADTHVHFLSPQTALLEGEAEGVNVVNLLASQWGELFTNVGDFTGSGENEAATRDGEHLVRVGTENRQHMLGHISLLGYQGPMILPLTTDGPSEAAFADPLEITLTQWAEQCRAQKGLNILPHFHGGANESAAAIVSNLIDGVEVTILGGPGINPYYLSDWYRYLNCGYHIAAVGGTDKMSARTPIGEIRTYAKLNGPLTYQAWADSVAAGRTFATMGPLVNMSIEGQDMGGRLSLSNGGGLTVSWDIASAVLPVTSIELVMNGDTVDGVTFDNFTGETSGFFTVSLPESAWLALRVRGRREDAAAPEIVVAHTSAIFVIVDDKPIFNGPDAASILDQIEGVTAYVKVLATKAIESQFKQALAALAGAHRSLHNRMHASGHFHHHTSQDKHPGH